MDLSLVHSSDNVVGFHPTKNVNAHPGRKKSLVSHQKTGFSLLPVGFRSAEGLSSRLFPSTPPPASSARCNIQQSRLHLSNSIPSAVTGEDHSSRTPPYFPSGDLSEGTRKTLSCRLKMAGGLLGTPPERRRN